MKPRPARIIFEPIASRIPAGAVPVVIVGAMIVGLALIRHSVSQPCGCGQATTGTEGKER